MPKAINVQHPGERLRVAEHSDRFFRTVCDAIDGGIFVADLTTGRFIDVNEFGCRMFGYQRSELVGGQVAMLTRGVPPYTEDAAVERIQAAKLRGPQRFEWHAKSKSGMPLWVEISLRYADIDRTPALVAIVREISERKRETEELLDVQAALTEAQAVAKVGSFKFDVLTNRTRWTDEMFRILGLAPKSVIPSFEMYLARIHPDDRVPLTDAYDRSLQSHAPGSLEQRVVWTDGTVRIVRARWQNFYGDDNKPVRTIGTVQDVTEREEAQRRLADSERKMKAIVESVQAGILIIDPEKHQIVDANPAAAQIFAAPRERIVGQDYQAVWPAGKRPITDIDQETGNVEGVLLNSAGQSVPILRSVAKVELAGKTFLIDSFIDITERKRFEEQLVHMARTDSLTGLPNRTVFVETLQNAISSANRTGENFAVLYLDLDHFKDINDALGHPVGDLLLQEIARRLQSDIRKTDLAARFGGDEFAVIAKGIADPMHVAILAQNILSLISAPCAIQDKQLRIGASIGIAYYDRDAPTAEMILSQADMALYKSKHEGRGTYRFFTTALDAEVRDRVTLGADLRDAIASNQLFLLYQPQVDAETNRIIGVEALVRWSHPTRGIILPDQFIAITEHIGLMVPLGLWVIRHACRQMRKWLDAGIAPPVVAVNASVMQFTTPFELERHIAAVLAEMNLQPASLELELTESALMTVSREHDEELSRLRKYGVRIAIDDFGTGYSSLAYLSRLPVNRIKIGQTFIRDLTTTSSNAAIVRAAIGMAHELALDVIVEGVETVDQLELIKSWDAHKVQGFYFARPLSADEIAPLLRAGTCLPAKRDELHAAESSITSVTEH